MYQAYPHPHTTSASSVSSLESIFSVLSVNFKYLKQ